MSEDGETTVNPPLTFELKNIDSKHPCLNDRGLDQKTIATFDLRSCHWTLSLRLGAPLVESRLPRRARTV